jgi:UDP-N-acetyl-D-mannosaminuronate dehydrogenase
VGKVNENTHRDRDIALVSELSVIFDRLGVMGGTLKYY